MRLSVIVPCYNEDKTLLHTLARVVAAPLPEGWSKEVIIVDDGSKSPTKEILKEIEERSYTVPISIVYKTTNGGKGSALKEGFLHVQGDYVLIQDADDEYDPNDYSFLLAPIVEGATQVVFGSRSMGASNIPFSAIYFYGSLLVTGIFNLAFGTRVSDIATCYKVFPRSYIPSFASYHSQDFVFDVIEMSHAIALKSEIIDVPISYKARTKEEGKKLNWKHGVRCLLSIVKLRLTRPMPAKSSFWAQVARFFVSGSIGASVNIGLLYLLTEFGHVWYLASSFVAVASSLVVSFILQKYWAFRSSDTRDVGHELPMFTFVAISNLFLNTLLLYFFVEHLHVWYVGAQAIASLLIALESFVLYRIIFAPELWHGVRTLLRSRS